MANKGDVYTLLRLFALRKKSQMIAFPEFVGYTKKYTELKKSETPSLASLSEDTELQLSAHLEDLAEDKRCALVYENGKIATIAFSEFFSEIVKRGYREIANDADVPFPSESSLGLKMPAESVTSVDVKADFVRLLGDDQESHGRLLRLDFPEDIHSIIVPMDLLKSALLDLSVEKIRLYLSTQQNSFYMLSKLRGVFRTKEQALRDMLKSVVAQRTHAMETIFNPTEFTFGFWTHLANAIIREYRQKTNKLEREHSYCQAAYLLGFYNVFFKGRIQKKKDAAAALKILDRRMRQAPYHFTTTDIANFKDEKGLLLTRKYSREQMLGYLTEKTTPKDDKSLPEVFRLKTPNKGEYYIAGDVLLPFTVKKIQDTSRAFRKIYLESWAKEMGYLNKTKVMKDDEAFAEDIDKRITTESPLLSALLSFEIQYLVLQDSKPSYDINQEISRILDVSRNAFIPSDQLLSLNRRDILAQAKMTLPLWKTLPVLNRILFFLIRALTGTQKKPTKKRKKKQQVPSAAPGAKLLGKQNPLSSADSPGGQPAQASQANNPRARAQALQEAMVKLKLQFVGNASLTTSMDELIEKWNPLFDPQAKANLVEDVNSLVRDFLRKLKKGFLVKPPDVSRIRTMADTLANNHAFDQIKKREALTRYIELYMISVIGGS